MEQIIGKYNSAKLTLPASQIDNETTQQIYDMCNNPAYAGAGTIVMMPDMHAGLQSSIGFTMKFDDRVDPRCVGVDVGCGMMTTCFWKSSLKYSLEEVDRIIQDIIPMGRCINTDSVTNNMLFISKIFNSNLSNKTFVNSLSKWLFHREYSEVLELLKRLEMKESTFWGSIGSLGGGNHFIELGEDDEKYYLTVHTGSRNFGLRVCNYHTNIMLNGKIDREAYAKEFKERSEIIRKTYNGVQIQNKIKELTTEINSKYLNKTEYLTDTNLDNYLRDMSLATLYASVNRRIIMHKITSILRVPVPIISYLECIHNYIDTRNKIIRKGAISAQEREDVIIPLNMKDGVILGKGKGNSDWNYSAPHGAGRVLSRSKAKQEVDMELYKLSMEGIYSTCINEHTIDESPFAYKDKDLIIDAIKDTVEITNIIKPVLNIKAGGE